MPNITPAITPQQANHEGVLVDQAMRRGVQDALRRHKALGQSVVEWRDGKVVWVAPEDIRLDDEPVEGKSKN